MIIPHTALPVPIFLALLYISMANIVIPGNNSSAILGKALLASTARLTVSSLIGTIAFANARMQLQTLEISRRVAVSISYHQLNPRVYLINI